MTVLMRWIEPVEPGQTKRRARPWDWIISFGVAAIFGLGAAEKSGPIVSVAFGNQFELSLPAQAWQYGLWLLIAMVAGSFGLWIVSFGGRAEVTIRDDGIGWLLGRATWRYYPYAQMQRCEFERVDEGNFWRLRVEMHPKQPGDLASTALIAIPKHVDRNRVREILQSAGIVATGLSAT